MIGRSICEVFANNSEGGPPPADGEVHRVQDVLKTIANLSVTGASADKDRPSAFKCLLRRRDGEARMMDVVLFGSSSSSSESKPGSQRFVMQFKVPPDAANADNPRAMIPLPRRSSARRSSLTGSGGTNVFAELATDRASSWQYELQQLKVENRRIQQEVANLESKLRPSTPQASASSSSTILNLDGSSSTRLDPDL